MEDTVYDNINNMCKQLLIDIAKKSNEIGVNKNTIRMLSDKYFKEIGELDIAISDII